MGQLSEDIAVIKTHVEYVRAGMDRIILKHEELEKRVDELERDGIKKTAWAAGAGAVVAFVGSNLHHLPRITKALFGLLMVVFLSGCGYSPGYAKWPSHLKPVEVAFDVTMPSYCIRNLALAVDVWRDVGVGYLQDPTPTTDPRRTFGRITVVYKRDELASQGKLGLTSTGHTARVRDEARDVKDSYVRLGDCSVNIIAHELGHALGLDDINDPDNLMHGYAVYPAPWNLDQDQIDWVR